MDARYWSGDDDRDFDIVEDGPCLHCEADANEPCEASCACPQCQRKRTTESREKSRWDACVLTPSCIHRHGHGGACQPSQLITLEPVALYAYAIHAGLNMLAELQGRRS